MHQISSEEGGRQLGNLNYRLRLIKFPRKAEQSCLETPSLPVCVGKERMEEKTPNDTEALRDFNITLYSIGPVLFVGNMAAGILFVVVVIKKELQQRKLFISLLSWVVADILLGMLLLGQIAIAHMDWQVSDNPALCLIWNALQVYPLWVSSLHAVICAIDRYIVVLCPNKYDVKLSKSRLKLYIGCSWGYGLLWILVPFIWYGKEKDGQICNISSLSHIYIFLLIVLHLLPATAACLCLYGRVLMHFRRHERQVHVTHTLTQDELVDNTRLARSLLYITILHSFVWFPFSLVGVARVFNLPLNSPWHMALLYAYLFGLVGCLFKLLLFGALDSEFRSSLKDVIGIRKQPLRFGASLQD